MIETKMNDMKNKMFFSTRKNNKPARIKNEKIMKKSHFKKLLAIIHFV
jgi:hypothetical protein